jgi:hypothetical protein
LRFAEMPGADDDAHYCPPRLPSARHGPGSIPEPNLSLEWSSTVEMGDYVLRWDVQGVSDWIVGISALGLVLMPRSGLAQSPSGIFEGGKIPLP